MTVDTVRLQSHRFSEIAQSYDPRDAILYALGLGLGEDPLDEDDLGYLLETRLDVLPSFAVTLASPGMWIRDPAFGVDFAKLVHSEQDAIFHRPLPPGTSVMATPRIAGLYDRGSGKGAVLIVERSIREAGSGQPYATVRQTLLLRGDGGFGGPPPPMLETTSPPNRPADLSMSVPVSPRAALIYRLSGDWNPLHSDPQAAAKAGFDRPILHGLASYGIAARAMQRMIGAVPTRVACRFSGIVFPGDTLDFKAWRQSDDLYAFEAFIGDRRVLDRGVFEASV